MGSVAELRYGDEPGALQQLLLHDLLPFGGVNAAGPPRSASPNMSRPYLTLQSQTPSSRTTLTPISKMVSPFGGALPPTSGATHVQARPVVCVGVLVLLIGCMQIATTSSFGSCTNNRHDELLRALFAAYALDDAALVGVQVLTSYLLNSQSCGPFVIGNTLIN